jgi:hypothetical protein
MRARDGNETVWKKVNDDKLIWKMNSVRVRLSSISDQKENRQDESALCECQFPTEKSIRIQITWKDCWNVHHR